MRSASVGRRVVVFVLLSAVHAGSAGAQVAGSGKEPPVVAERVRGRGASGPFDRRFRYTDTWLYRDGRWRVIAAHDYLVAVAR